MVLNQAWFDHVKVCPTPLLPTKMYIVFVFDQLDNFWKLFLKNIEKNALIKTHWGSLERIVTYKGFLMKKYLPKFLKPWLWFGTKLPKDILLKLIGKHSSYSEHISKQAISRWYTFLAFTSTIIFSKMLCLSWKFENLIKIYIILLSTHFYVLLNYKSMLNLNLIICLHIKHKECWLGRYPAPGRRCYTKELWKLN